VEVFRKFLDADYSTAQLTFFLRVRAKCLRRAITIIAKPKESDEQYSEVIMTASHAVELTRRVFTKAGPDLTDVTVRRLREEFVRRPSPTVDPSISYISMMSFLEICLETFNNYEMLELRKMMHAIQIIPKPDGRQFTRIVKDLIPILPDPEIAELFRIVNQTVVGKTQIKKGKFKRMFRARSLLVGEVVDELKPLAKSSPELERARAKWAKLQPILDNVLESTVEKGAPDPTLSHEAQCLRLEMDQVSAALTCLDVVGVHSHILSCVMLYQAIRWTTSEPDPDSMDQVTNAVRAILHI
jgi:hypothetical protein